MSRLTPTLESLTGNNGQLGTEEQDEILRNSCFETASVNIACIDPCSTQVQWLYSIRSHTCFQLIAVKWQSAARQTTGNRGLCCHVDLGILQGHCSPLKRCAGRTILNHHVVFGFRVNRSGSLARDKLLCNIPRRHEELQKPYTCHRYRLIGPKG